MIQQPNPHRVLSPIRLLAERQTRPQQIIDTDTQILAVNPRALVPVETLPMDNQGRRFVRVINPYEHTFDLTEALVDRFYGLQGYEPSEIVLSVPRYFTFGRAAKFFYSKRVGAIPIRFKCEGSFQYDVIVRGPRCATLIGLYGARSAQH